MTAIADCVCASCGTSFALPALAICPACNSRQIRRIPTLRESDVLGETFEESRLRDVIREAAQAFEDIGLRDSARELRAAMWPEKGASR